jgi:hypothetical protein
MWRPAVVDKMTAVVSLANLTKPRSYLGSNGGFRFAAGAGACSARFQFATRAVGLLSVDCAGGASHLFIHLSPPGR